MDRLREWNIDLNTISSLMVESDTKITLHNGGHFDRPMATFYENEKDLGSIHNRTARVKVERRVWMRGEAGGLGVLAPPQGVSLAVRPAFQRSSCFWVGKPLSR